MKFVVLQENIRNAVNLTSHFTANKSQLPLLGNILLKANKTKLILSSTNLETSISVSISAQVEQPGEITVNGKIFNDIISHLTSDRLEVEVSKEQLKLTSGSFKSTVLGSNSSEFPKVPQSTSDNSFLFEQNTFKEALSKILFSVSQDETRPVLTGVLFSFVKEYLYLVATDGFRLSHIKLPNKVKSADFSLIIPKSVLNELLRLDTDENFEFSYDKKNNQVVFVSGGIILSSRVIEGNFPDFQKIIPSSFVCNVIIDKIEFEKSIKLASVFARDSGNIIKLVITENCMKVKAESSTIGSQETEIEVKTSDFKSQELEIMFNFRFIEELLKIITGNEIEIQISGPNSAAKFLDMDKKDFFHLIMPIKI